MRQFAIEQHARWLRLIIVSVVGLLALIYVVARFGIGLPGLTVESRAAAGSPYPEWVGDITLLLLLVATWPLVRMLRRIESGDAFSVASIRDFRAFAGWLLGLSLFRTVSPTMLGFAAAQSSAPFIMMVDVRDLLLLMITLILFLVARLFERARAAEEDMREIV